MPRPRTAALPPLLAALLAVLAVARRLLRRRPRPVAGPDHVVAEDGTLLHVEEDGDPHADLTVVLVHGFTARLAEYDLQREALRSRARLVLYDQRGHGRSGWGAAERATIDQLGRDLASVLEQRVPTGPVVLVGHSLGGMTVMSLARQRPELIGPRVVGAFLLATSAGELVTDGPLGATVKLLRRLHLLGLYLRAVRLLAPVLERFRRRGTPAGRLLYRRLLFGRDDATPQLVTLVQSMLEETPLSITSAFWATFVAHDETASLEVLRRVPTTVLCGTHDALTPVAHSRRIAALLGPSAELVEVPGAGHSVNITRPEVVDAALLRLLDRAREELVARPRSA